MAEDLKFWLRTQSHTLCAATMQRAPNMLPDEEDIAEFLTLLVEYVGEAREKQLSAIQFWALTSIGHDAPMAMDWLTVLRVLKEEIAYGLDNFFSPAAALRCWHQLDDILTYALIEATQLGSDMDRAALLEHMVNLRQQMEKVEQAKSNFIAVAAHELKTPLTILQGYANMLRAETTPDSQLRVYVEGLENGTRRMNEIIEDIIDVSLIDLHTFELKYQNFYLEKIILMVADNLDKAFQKRRVELVIMPMALEQRIYGDPERLHKAFSKVLLNALKYTPDGGRVTISSAVVRQNEANDEIAGYVDVQITDTGIGINPENLEVIFDKFTSISDVSLHSSGKTKFKGGGPGLGLPIARGIIEAHGGRIWAESPGYNEVTYPGTTFHIELPILLKLPELLMIEE